MNTYNSMKELHSPEVNLISPTQDRVRILDEVQEFYYDSRPNSRLTRSHSLRNKKPPTPRPQWRN